jgi:hypothetical protein
VCADVRPGGNVWASTQKNLWLRIGPLGRGEKVEPI